MRDILHDEIDQLEELRSNAREKIIDLVHGRLPEILSLTGDPLTAMVVVSREVEGMVIADATTEAFGAGAEFSRKRFAGGG